ncbi:MAG: DUF951 domain-containing protein [Clostridia bacterium]|nr:DUF951 domain-containing protein [Clostridia bacterium]
MNIPKFEKGDTLIMKKKHPCGSSSFEVLRTGSDIRIKCTGCGHDLTVPRVKLEKNIKKVEYALCKKGEDNI